MNAREEFVQGLRAFADWLADTAGAEAPQGQRMLLPLHTNAAVEAFAAEHGLTLAYDDEGNASADLMFGPLAYHAYGYVDFDAHCAAEDERLARRWAEKNGLIITAATAGGAA